MTTLLLALVPGAAMAFATIERGELSGIDAPRQVVVRDRAAWAALWREHAPERTPPAVDFTRAMVVGVFLGTRPTASHGVSITRVTRADGEIVVHYREDRPPPGALVVQILTSPYHLVRVERADGRVRFERETAAGRDGAP